VWGWTTTLKQPGRRDRREERDFVGEHLFFGCFSLRYSTEGLVPTVAGVAVEAGVVVRVDVPWGEAVSLP